MAHDATIDIRIAARALCWILFLFVIVVGQTLAQADYEVRAVDFQGNVSFAGSRLSEVTAAYGTGWIKRTLFGKDPYRYDERSAGTDARRLKAFYQRNGFLYATVDTEIRNVDHDKRTLSMVFTINEGAPVLVDAVKWTYSDSSAASAISDTLRWNVRSELRLRSGVRFADQTLQDDRKAIVSSWTNAGYAYATADPHLSVDTTAREVTVTWHIDTGPLCQFGDVQIDGNEVIDASLVRKQLAFETGQRYNRGLLDASQNRIYDLGVFQIATVSGRLARIHDPVIPVRVQLKVAPIWSVKLGAGWGREDGLRAFFDFRLLDFLGGARRLSVNVKHSKLEPYAVTVTVSQPSLFSPRTTGSISPFVRREKEPGFTVDRWGGSASLSHTISRTLSASMTYTLERIQLDTASISDEVVIDDQLDELYNRSSITLASTFDNSRPLFSPEHGLFSGVVVKVAGLGFGSQYKYYRPIVDLRHYDPFIGATLASRVKLGGISRWGDNAFVPVEDRLYSGGSNSIRGWARSELGPRDVDGKPLGGKSLLEAALELRVPVYGAFSTVFFFEGGNVWRKSFDYRLGDLRYAAGAGIRYTTPVGPIRFDIARPVFDDENRLQLHLSVGQAF